MYSKEFDSVSSPAAAVLLALVVVPWCLAVCAARSAHAMYIRLWQAISSRVYKQLGRLEDRGVISDRTYHRIWRTFYIVRAFLTLRSPARQPIDPA